MTHILLPLAPGFEDLEAITLVDILRRGGLHVTTAGLSPGPVQGARGTTVLPDTVLESVLDQEFDMIILPGGQPGTRNLHQDERIKALLLRFRDQGKFIAAICAAPSILAAYGLLQGKRATSYPGALDAAQSDLTYSEDSVVVDGNIVTSRGPGTAMDFALTLVDILQGPAQRLAVENALIRP